MAAAKATAQILDFTNVKDRGDYNPVHVEPGEYLMKISAVVDSESKQGNAMWVFALSHVAPPVPTAARATYPFYCVLDAKSLWKVRGLAISAGYNVPKSRFSLDPNKLVGRVVGVIVEDDEYEGKVRSKIAQVMPPDEVDGAPSSGTTTDEDDQGTDDAYAPDTDQDLDGVDL